VVSQQLRTDTKSAPHAQKTLGQGLGRIFRQRESGIAIVAVLLIIVFQLLNNSFLSLANLKVVFQLSAEIAIVAVAEVMVMVLGEIDLSVGNVFAFSPFIMYFAYQAGMPLILAVVAGLVAALAVGLVNGLLHVKLKVPSFIATLATLYAVKGLTLVISNGYPVTTPGSGWLTGLLGASPWAIVWWAVIVAAVWHFLLKHNKFGIYTIAVGSNAVGSREVGIPTDRIRMVNFVLAALLGGLVGIVESFHVQSIDPLAGGTSILLQGIAAAVIGGTALTGGSGTIVGAVIGSIVIASLNDGMNLLGVNAYLFDVVLGIAIGIAMILNIRMMGVRGGRQ